MFLPFEISIGVTPSDILTAFIILIFTHISDVFFFSQIFELVLFNTLKLDYNAK